MRSAKRAPLAAIIVAAQVLLTSDGLAQEGPYVPCAGISCEDPKYKPWPETGSWYNPQQSGTGLTVEIQNGVLLAYYFGYDAEGEPEWLMLSGPLQPGESEGVLWQIEVAPLRVSGGNCRGCAYVPPVAFEPQIPIRIEFLQRAYARVTTEGTDPQYFVPLMYGEDGIAFFEETTPYKFPVFTENPYDSVWTLTVKYPADTEPALWTWRSGIVIVDDARIIESGADAGKLLYLMYTPTTPPEVLLAFGQIVCGPTFGGSDVICQFESPYIEPAVLDIAVGNFGDSRIVALAEDGTRLEAFRLQYD